MTPPLSVLNVITATSNSYPRILELALSIRSIKSKLEDPSLLNWCVQDNLSGDLTVQSILDIVPDVSLESVSDRSLYEAWNKALKRAKPGWVIFLGDDDNLSFPFVQQCLEASYTSNTCLVASVCLMSLGRPYGTAKIPTSKYLPVRSNAFCHPGVAFPLSIYHDSPFIEEYNLISDMIFYYSTDPLVVKRLKGTNLISMSVDGATGRHRGVLLILSEYFHAVYTGKIPLSLLFICRKLLLVFALRYGLASALKSLRWALPFYL